MSSSDLLGTELVRLLNKYNSSQGKLVSLEDIKDYLLESEIDANIIISALLADILLEIKSNKGISSQLRDIDDKLKILLT